MSERSLMVETIETKPTLRRRIIDAADSLIREHGLSGATTREIARAAGCAEGSIYVHFEDKIDLVIAVIVEREPYFAELLELPGRAGQATVEANLVPWVEELASLIRDNQPIFFALMSDRGVLDRFKARIRERQTGLVAVFNAASDYARAEQELGRVDAGVEPDVVATILIGATRDYTWRLLTGTETPSTRGFAQNLIRTVVHGLAPITSPGAAPPNLEEESA
jgi:AcrR family transcriptional regulator